MTFRLHFKSDDHRYLHGVYGEGFDHKAADGDPAFWIVYLLNAFQGALGEDGDPEPGLMGITDNDPATGRGGYGAAIFQESGRETAKVYADRGFPTGWRMLDVAPHEIGHLFGGEHAGNGLMAFADVKSADFAPITLDRIRSRDHP